MRFMSMIVQPQIQKSIRISAVRDIIKHSSVSRQFHLIYNVLPAAGISCYLINYIPISCNSDHKNTLMLGNRYEISPCAMNAMKYQEGINHIPLQSKTE
jgi:hypothetical protein